MSGRRLVNSYGSIYSMTDRQWLKFCGTAAAGRSPDVPGRFLGVATSITDWDPRDARGALDVLCQTCGGDIPHDKLWHQDRPAAHPRHRTSEEAEQANDKCPHCGAHLAHSLRAAEHRRRKDAR